MVGYGATQFTKERAEGDRSLVLDRIPSGVLIVQCAGEEGCLERIGDAIEGACNPYSVASCSGYGRFGQGVPSRECAERNGEAGLDAGGVTRSKGEGEMLLVFVLGELLAHFVEPDG